MRSVAGLTVAVLFVAFGSQAQAGLLTAAYEAKLEEWLGEGDLDFTNIFTKVAGDDSRDFHAAVDGKGRTFTLIELLQFAGNPTREIIGGYNPQSWDSSNQYHLTSANSQRTAFLYNLDAGLLPNDPGVIQRQNLEGQSAPLSGLYQTLNRADYGPTFGGGHDLYVDSTLNAGAAYNYSYGGTSYFGLNIYGGVNQGNGGQNGQYGQIEVYTFAPAAAVPEPGSLTLLGLGSIGLMGYARRRRQAA